MSSKTSTTAGGDQQLMMHRIRMAHLEDMPSVAFRGTGLFGWFYHLFDDIRFYMKWFLKTWFEVVTSLPNFILDPFGSGLVLMFAIATTVILAIMVFVNAIVRLPIVKNIWNKISADAGGVGLGNIAYPKIFESLDSKIRDAAYKVMADPLDPSSQPSTATERVFDLEVAKVLMCCSALVYERNVEMVHDAAKLTAGVTIKTKTGLATGSPLKQNGNMPTSRGQEIMDKLDKADEKITSVAHSWGLEYISLSELANNNSPVCGAFYQPSRNFIILVFKGTNPVEFREWAIDFTISYTNGGAWLPGHGKVHSGFYETLFPSDISPSQRAFPYEEIRTRVRDIAQQLCQNTHDHRVNLYVTGHSLGAGLASFFYARAIASPRDFGLNEDGEHLIRVRDCYAFACPIFGDPQSISAFGEAVHQDLDNPLTLWRITNRHDAVATMLPEAGDYELLQHISPGSQFHYAHIGQEIQMRRFGNRLGTGPGTQLPKGAKVKIITHLGGDGSGPYVQLPLWYRVLEEIPGLDRLVGHIASSYWARLSTVEANENVSWYRRENIFVSL